MTEFIHNKSKIPATVQPIIQTPDFFEVTKFTESTVTNFHEETPNSNISNELNEICAELNIDIQTKNHVDFKTLDHRHHSPEAEILSQNPNNYLLSTIPAIDTVAKNIEIFICHICDQSFTTFTMLENHLLKVHESCENVTKITCTFCDKSFKQERYLLEHDKFFHQNIKFKCTESGCDKVFRRKGKLMNHIAKIHSESKIFSSDKIIENEKLNQNIITKITDSENATMVSIFPTTSYEENKVHEDHIQIPQHPNYCKKQKSKSTKKQL